MDVAVVGGGIVGMASATALAERGVDVVVLERATLGAGATDRAAGGIRAQFTTEVAIELATASIDTWETFEDTHGVDIAYRRPGYCYLAREPSTASVFREAVRFQNDRGVPSEFLTAEAAADLVPGLRVDTYVGAAFCPTDGFADPHLGLRGFARAARAAGATVETGVEVVDLVREGGAVRGVDATDGRYDVECVVLAAGAWSAPLAGTAEVDLRVLPRRRQVAVVEPESPFPESAPFTVDRDANCYVRPERDGVALVGGHFGGPDPPADPDGYRIDVDLDWVAEALERVASVSDVFGPGTRFRRGWAGLYAVTPDHHPILDEPVPGLVVATGFSGHGFMLAPATGRVVAELVLDGEATTVDVSPLAVDRFERGETLEERYTSV